MPIIRADEIREHVTPNATMHTLASPTLGGSALALWRVRMEAGQAGPAHRIDGDQVWTITAGSADVTIDDDAHAVSSGESLVLPAGSTRQIAAGTQGLEAIAASAAGVRAALSDGTDKGTPPWLA